ncbi:hypothetical protein ACHAXH_000331 [Discostella pseudostelligera]
MTSSETEPEDLLNSLELLIRWEEHGGYSLKSSLRRGYSPYNEPFHLSMTCQRWYEWVDRCKKVDRDVVNIAYHYRHLHLANEVERRGIPSQAQVRLISISSLLLAMKVMRHRMNWAVNEQRLVHTLVRDLGDDTTDVSGVYRMEREMHASLGELVYNVTSVRQFASIICQLHPVICNRPDLLDYVFSVTCFQAEKAFLHPVLMTSYKPSTIVFAALLRFLDEDGVVYNQMMGTLEPIIADEREVVEAIFALENCIPDEDIPRSEESEAIIAAYCDEAEAAVHQAMAAYLAAYDPADSRPESPCCVDGV